jgi:hypothetical protein
MTTAARSGKDTVGATLSSRPPMEQGVAAGYGRLAEYLASIVGRSVMPRG